MNADAIVGDPELLEEAVARLTRRSGFMAHLLSMALGGDASAARIAGELGCPLVNAIRLALMRVPRTGRETFRLDVTLIAEAAGVDRTRLLAVIRQAQVLSGFDAEDRTAGDQQGILMAARDVVPGGSDQEG